MKEIMRLGMSFGLTKWNDRSNLINGAFKYVGSDMKIWAVKKEGKLFPANVEDQVKINKLPAGEPIMIKFTKVRNPYHHRKYFAFINTVYQNLPHKFDNYWPDVDSFRKAMQMYAGYYTETVSLKGETHLQPKSIKFEELDEMGFTELHNKVKSIIGTKILPEMDMETFEQEIQSYY